MISHHAVLLPVADPATHELPPAALDTDREVFLAEKIRIDDVRSITEKANRMPRGEAKRLEIVVIATTLTVEAQQALLKIVEEPPQTTSFIFVLPVGVQLLPTLLSRFSVSESSLGTATEAFSTFNKQPIAERLAAIDAAVKSKDTVWQEAMKSGLLWHLRTADKNMSTADLHTLHFVASTLLTRGAANKMLFEALALTL
jgi:hypothetical protein